MKSTTCSLLVGTTITGLVIFLLSFDIISKRRNSLSNHLLTKDQKKSDISSKTSDLHFLALINKKIEKLEEKINSLLSKTEKKSKANEEAIVQNYTKFGTYKDKLSDNNSNDRKKDDAFNKQILNPNIRTKESFNLKGENSVLQKKKDETMIKEISQAPTFSSYNLFSGAKLPSNKELHNGDTDNYMNTFHLNFESWPLDRNSNEREVNKSSSSVSSSKEKNNLFGRELTNLAPTLKSMDNSLAIKSNESLITFSSLPEKKAANSKQEVQTKEKVSIENKKPKTTGFIQKSVDEAIIPVDNIPNLTDFSSHDANYRPIFFTEKKKEIINKSLPSSITEISVKVMNDENKTIFSSDRAIKKDKKNKVDDALIKSEILIKPKISKEDTKAITEAIDSIFESVPSSTSKVVQTKQDDNDVLGDITKSTKHEQLIMNDKMLNDTSKITIKSKDKLANYKDINKSKKELIFTSSISPIKIDKNNNRSEKYKRINNKKLPTIIEERMNEETKNNELVADKNEEAYKPEINRNLQSLMSDKEILKNNETTDKRQEQNNSTSKKEHESVTKEKILNNDDKNEKLDSKEEKKMPLVINETSNEIREIDEPTTSNVPTNSSNNLFDDEVLPEDTLDEIFNKEYYVVPNQKTISKKIKQVESPELKLLKSSISGLNKELKKNKNSLSKEMGVENATNDKNLDAGFF